VEYCQAIELPRWPSLVECSQAIELDHQVLLLLDTPVAVVLLPVSYYRSPTSGFLLPERIANA